MKLISSKSDRRNSAEQTTTNTQVRKPTPKKRHGSIVWFLAIGLILITICGAIIGSRSNSVSIEEDNSIPWEDILPSTPKDDWKLLLVNPWNEVPAGHQIKLTQLVNGQSIDERAYPELQQMMDDCRADGLSPVICSSYRTRSTQQQLFDNKVSRLTAEGYSPEAAKIEAAKAVAVPGTSEHELGLAVDIVDINYQHLDEAQEKTAVQKWLIDNSWKYGFILRYPNEKSEVTGIIYEPWHYRYVGKEAAKEIYEQGICLEEYLK